MRGGRDVGKVPGVGGFPLPAGCSELVSTGPQCSSRRESWSLLVAACQYYLIIGRYSNVYGLTERRTEDLCWAAGVRTVVRGQISLPLVWSEN